MDNIYKNFQCIRHNFIKIIIKPSTHTNINPDEYRTVLVYVCIYMKWRNGNKTSKTGCTMFNKTFGNIFTYTYEKRDTYIIDLFHAFADGKWTAFSYLTIDHTSSTLKQSLTIMTLLYVSEN